MRLNPLVCVQVEELRGHDDWTSIVIFGQYIEIPNGPEFAKSREHIRSLLEKRALWWQSGYTASKIRRKLKPPTPVFFYIRIEEMTGLAQLPTLERRRIDARPPTARADNFSFCGFLHPAASQFMRERARSARSSSPEEKSR
jgi:hypothetical protein